MKLTVSIDADTRENLLIALEDVWGLIEAKKWQGRASFSDRDAEEVCKYKFEITD
jgi:hypothetical protein